MNNLELFRASIKEFLPSQEIESMEEFKELINHLCDIKLLHPEEVKKLTTRFQNNEEIRFPINFQQLQLIIMTNFGDQRSHLMLENLKNIKEKLRQTKGILSIWKDKGLTKKQRYELQSIFQRGNAKMRQFYAELIKQKQGLENISEQQLQMIDSLNEWVKVQKIQQLFKNYEQYQEHHKKLIDQTYNRLRVREVHFKQRKNTSKVTKIQVITGMDSKNDEPVEVTLIPKRSLEFNIFNTQLLTFNAKKQLMLSAHFNRFLGYNSHADAHCFFYFSEYIDGTNLAEFVRGSRVELEEETPIFKYWVYLLYKSLYDIYLMCSYLPKLPLKLKDYEIANNGLKLVLKNVQFIESREEAEPEYYQADLLNNLGNLILQLINVQTDAWATQTRITKIQNRSVLNCLLNAQLGHRNYRQSRAKVYLTFFNLQTHPLFESKNFLMGETIMDNYDSLKNSK